MGSHPYMHGEVLWQHNLLFKRGIDGKWVTGFLLISWRINGYINHLPLLLLPDPWMFHWMRWYHFSLSFILEPRIQQWLKKIFSKWCFGHIKYSLKYVIACWLDGMGVLTKGEFHDQKCIQIGSGIKECRICWGFIQCAKSKTNFGKICGSFIF